MRRREAHGVAEAPVFGLRPGTDGGGDQILVREAGSLTWVEETARPELAAATWKLQRRVLERRGRTKRRGDSCRCIGCLSPNCGECKGPPACQGTGERMRCRNRWCENTRILNGKEVKGRGKLLREREGALPPSRPIPGHYLQRKMCVGLCHAAMGDPERQSPCPQVEWGRLWYERHCACGKSARGNGEMHAKHWKECARAQAEGAEKEWQNAQVIRLRNIIESDASVRRCGLAQCMGKMMGIRGHYHHLVQDHWTDLPKGSRLAAAAHSALWGAIRMGEDDDPGLRVQYQSLYPMMSYESK